MSDNADIPVSNNSDAARNKDQHILDVAFTGSAKEYFGIWIVNILLSIVTLGIYSAWAKVRRKRYFNGNTWIDGHNFEYHADPIAILKGRVIVFGLFVIYQVAANVAPAVAGVLSILILIILPWLINKGLAFNARMTSYRNVRFSFVGSYWKGLLSLVILPFVSFLSLGLLLPLSTQQQAKYVFSNHSFGNARFHTHPPQKPLYLALLICAGIIIVLGAVVFAIGATTMNLTDGFDSLNEDVFSDPSLFLDILPILMIFYVAMILIFLLPYIYYSVKSYNLTINSLSLDDKHRFGSNVKTLRYAWILISNLIVTLFTLGLMAPWAHIRKMKYLAAHLFILPGGSLEDFVDTKRSEGNVASSEYMDLDGIDFGF